MLMARANQNKIPAQTVGNIGLFYVCYRLSRMGWNVLPTSRNAMGVDILIYSQDAKKKFSVQVKSFSKQQPVSFGESLDKHLLADFFVVCCGCVTKPNPECFILKPEEIPNLASRDKGGKMHYWLQPKAYKSDDFRERWDIIGCGYSAEC